MVSKNKRNNNKRRNNKKKNQKHNQNQNSTIPINNEIQNNLEISSEPSSSGFQKNDKDYFIHYNDLSSALEKGKNYLYYLSKCFLFQSSLQKMYSTYVKESYRS